VKVTQRFPVRISLANPTADKLLRVGASATVTIDTTKNENTTQDKK
jgi:multidrug resistance efflux pump